MRLYFDPDSGSLAQTWRQRFELIPGDAPPDGAGHYLRCHDNRLSLHRAGDPRGAWVTPADINRRAAARSELERACGSAIPAGAHVVDAMAGWGVDGLTLAAGGARVTLIERHAAVWALLDDLVRRLRAAGWPGAERVMLVAGDAWPWLEGAAACDIVFLDPMFPKRNKGALPGKRLQYLAELTEPDPHPLAAWLELARRRARDRVVLKRRLRDPVIGHADWQIRGRRVRYDVYRGAPQAPRRIA